MSGRETTLLAFNGLEVARLSRGLECLCIKGLVDARLLQFWPSAVSLIAGFSEVSPDYGV